jgi:hypothetical protein
MQDGGLAAGTASDLTGFGYRGGRGRTAAATLLLLALLLAQLLALSGSRLEPLSLQSLIAALPGDDSAAPAAPTKGEIAERLRQAPLGFVENVGQAPRSVSHTAQGPGYSFAFGERGVQVSLIKQEAARRAAAKGAGASGLSLGLAFIGSNPDARAELLGSAQGRVDYLVGERSRWRTGLATHPGLVYRDLWPGIDMAFKGSAGTLKYEFRLSPGADPSQIRLAYQGAQSLSLTGAGALQVQTARGKLTDAAPVSYQRHDGRRVAVESSYALGQGTGYGFTVGSYDRSQPLVIDPGLEYSTFLGGSGFDVAFAIAVQGNDAYITGGTASPDFPTTPNAFQPGQPPSPGGPLAQDAFVARIDTRKSGPASLEYSSFLGGSFPDAGFGIAVAGDDAFVTGPTFSPNFPTTANAYDPSFNGPPGGSDGFVTRLDTGKAGAAGLEYSTYLGGAANDRGLGIDIKGAEAYLTGLTESGDFPATGNAFDQSHNGGEDAFVTRLDTGRPGTAGLEYSTFLGDTSNDSGRGLAVKGDDAFVTGPTQSSGFPVTGNAFDGTDNGGEDGFVSRVDTGRAGAASLTYSTYLGGNTGDDSGRGIDVHENDAFLTGVTTSGDFPVTPSGFQQNNGGSVDAFVTRLDTKRAGPAGLRYSTYLGGFGPDDFQGLAAGGIAAHGNDAYVTGATFSPNFPTTPDAFQPAPGGGGDAFVSLLDTKRSGAASLEYSTYLGGFAPDLGRGVAVGGNDAFVTGGAISPNFPTTPNAFQGFNRGGGGDAFLTRLDIK